jgi:hypothetical protein
MEREKFTPVLGWGSQKIIGYWDEINKKFISTNKETMLEVEFDFLSGNEIFPIGVRIMDEKINGNYATYRAIGVKPEDPRVIIFKTK